MMTNYIEIKNLFKNFGKNKVLKNISINIAKGERVALMGPNGTGKTALIEILLKIEKPTKGIAKITIPFNKVGIQFQEANFPSGVSTNDIIKLFNEINETIIAKEDFQRELKTFEMQSFIENDANSLSGGQKQKLNLLLAMIHNPDLIILDEITTGLDISARNSIVNYIERKIKKDKKTLLLVSHDINEVLMLADRLIYLQDGKVFIDKNIKDIDNINDFFKKLHD